jgi:hypothetical protein
MCDGTSGYADLAEGQSRFCRQNVPGDLIGEVFDKLENFTNEILFLGSPSLLRLPPLAFAALIESIKVWFKVVTERANGSSTILPCSAMCMDTDAVHVVFVKNRRTSVSCRSY